MSSTDAIAVTAAKCFYAMLNSATIVEGRLNEMDNLPMGILVFWILVGGFVGGFYK